MPSIERMEFATKEFMGILLRGLRERALEQGHNAQIHPFCFALKDQEDQVIGGVVGNTFYGCLYTDTLWVHSSYRGTGWGRQLMQQAEETGRQRGCTFACVNTMEWEARAFYERLDYEVEFTRAGFDKGAKLFYLRKAL